MYIDSHCHLNFKAFDKDLNHVIQMAKNSGVLKIIIPGAKIDSSKKGIAIADKFSNCYAAVGVHPHHANEHDPDKKLESELRKIAHSKKVVAIGEIGLDKHNYKDYPKLTQKDLNRQKKLMLFQIKIASELQLPIIFHCRDAYDMQLDIIKSLAKKMHIRGVFHCFEGEISHLKDIMKLNLYVGFDGNITYPKNEKIRNLVKDSPLDKILIETDSPYLTPLPYRGQRNEPQNLPIIAKLISDIKKVSLSTVENSTALNASRLFKI